MLNWRGLDKGGRANLFFTFAVGGVEQKQKNSSDNTFDHSLLHQYDAKWENERNVRWCSVAEIREGSADRISAG